MKVDLLIGIDLNWGLVTGDVHRGEWEPTTIRNQVGYVLSGVAPLPRDAHAFHASHSFLGTHVLWTDTSTNPKESLEDILHSFWKLKSLGIETTEKSVLERFVQSICFKNSQ